MTAGARSSVAARMWWTSGRCPRSHSRSRSRAGGSLTVGGRVGRLSSLIVRSCQAQFAGNPFDRPVELDAAGVGRAAEPGRDVGPGEALGAQVGQLPLLGTEAVAELLEQFAPGDGLAGARL